MHATCAGEAGELRHRVTPVFDMHPAVFVHRTGLLTGHPTARRGFPSSQKPRRSAERRGFLTLLGSHWSRAHTRLVGRILRHSFTLARLLGAQNFYQTENAFIRLSGPCNKHGGRIFHKCAKQKILQGKFPCKIEGYRENFPITFNESLSCFKPKTYL